MAASSFCALPQQTSPTSHIQAPSKTHCSIKVKPKATQSSTNSLLWQVNVLWKLTQWPGLKDSSYALRCICVPLPEAQVSQEQKPAHCKEMIPLFTLAFFLWWKKKSVKKNPTKNLEEGYPALTGLSTLGLRPGQTKWTLARWLLPKPICSSESCFFCCWMETKVLLILHGMALWVNLIKNNLGLRTKINVCAAGGKGTNSCNTEQRAMHQTRWANHRKDHGTNAKADIGMGSKKLKRWRGKGGGTEP